MNKKVLAIVGLALVISVSGGVIALNSGGGDSKKSNDTSSAAADPEHGDAENGQKMNDEPNDDPMDVIAEDETDEADSSEPAPDDADATESAAAPTSFDGTVEPSVPYDEQIISQTMYIKFVVDHTTGAEASPRVVFGADYESCYIAFSPNQTFEMCIDPASGATRSGSYQIFGDVVSVTYDDGTGSEFDILVDEAGNITHVIVNYGDYNVYFG